MYLTKQYNPRIKNQTDKLFKNFNIYKVTFTQGKILK